MDTTPSTSDPDTSPAPGGQLDIPVCQRAEFLAATLMLAKQEGTEEALHAASRGLEVLFDEGMDPSTRGLLVVSVPPDLAETFIAAYSLIPRELRAKWKRETANGYERMADEAEANGDHLLADAARANIAPQRRAARALAGKASATPALHNARRRSTKSLNRLLRDEGYPRFLCPVPSVSRAIAARQAASRSAGQVHGGRRRRPGATQTATVILSRQRRAPALGGKHH